MWHKLYRMQTCGLAILCLIIACFGSTCITPIKNSKGSDLPNSKNSQPTYQSKVDAQGKSFKGQNNSSSSDENVAHGGVKARTTSHNKSSDSLLGNLTKEEKNVLSWLIGGVLGLAFIMLIIKGVISRHK